MALGLAIIVAYVSVTGLMKVFTGAGVVGLIFFIAIELAKVVGTTAIHTFRKRLNWWLKGSIGICIAISMVITSLGIYGYLSNSYKASYAEMENTNSQMELLESRRDGYKEQYDILVEERTSLNGTISELTKGLANNVIEYVDPETGQLIRTTSSSTRKALEKQLDNAQIRLVEVNIKSDSLSNIVFDLENQILEVKLNDDAAQELSTLLYLSDITGMSMDDVMKWFILLLIVIGDPWAVLFVIALNKVVNYGDTDDPEDNKDPELIPEPTPEPEPELVVPEPDDVEEDVAEEDEVDDKKGPVIPTGKVERSDLPKAKTKIERIGSNKEIRDDDKGRVFFKKRN